MIRSVSYVIVITAVAGLLTLGCKQQDSATNTKDTKTATEATTSNKETDTGSSRQTEPKTTQDTAGRAPDETAGTESGQAEQTKAAEWKEGTPEQKKKNIERQRKELIDKQTSEGLYTGIEEDGPTVKVYVADSFHDLNKRDRRFNIKNIYAYYHSVNPDVDTVIAYDQNTGREIMKINAESFIKKQKKKKKKKGADEAQ